MSALMISVTGSSLLMIRPGSHLVYQGETFPEVDGVQVNNYRDFLVAK
jgi:hypothetical protein